MLISLITAWLATIAAILAALKIFVKKNQKLNSIFHKIHIPLGIILITAAFIHGSLAGNPLGTSLKQASIGSMLYTVNMGTISLILSILLGLSYAFRKLLKGKWMKCHRILTLLLVFSIVIHIAQMGITLPEALASKQSQPTNVTIENTDNLVTFSGASLKDGSYEGTATGFKGNITVEVTVENGAVSAIDIISENDTPSYFERAQEIISSILDAQSLEVDSVSGATYSSIGIRDAVYNALLNAVESGELNITEVQLPDKHGSHGQGHH